MLTPASSAPGMLDNRRIQVLHLPAGHAHQSRWPLPDRAVRRRRAEQLQHRVADPQLADHHQGRGHLAGHLDAEGISPEPRFRLQVGRNHSQVVEPLQRERVVQHGVGGTVMLVQHEIGAGLLVQGQPDHLPIGIVEHGRVDAPGFQAADGCPKVSDTQADGEQTACVAGRLGHEVDGEAADVEGAAA
jgi:hypothetical protein